MCPHQFHQLEYLLPRLAGGWAHLERQEGAIGTRGPGETQLETDRRLIRLNIRDLKKKLKGIEGEREIQRKGRKDMFNACLVGYTNAGKSTIFNLLTGEKVIAENYLFATLDSTTRRIKLPRGAELLLSDTVGFIEKLPISLVASFKSTLLEASKADLLIHVIDISDEDYESKIKTVNGVLKEIGCSSIPSIYLFNKIDLNNDTSLFKTLLSVHPGSGFISALTGEGVERFLGELVKYQNRSYKIIKATLKTGDSQSMSLLNSIGQIIDMTSVDDIIEVILKAPKNSLGKLKEINYELIDDYNENKK